MYTLIQIYCELWPRWDLSLGTLFFTTHFMSAVSFSCLQEKEMDPTEECDRVAPRGGVLLLDYGNNRQRKTGKYYSCLLGWEPWNDQLKTL